MALINTKKTALFLAIGAIPPTPVVGFVETMEPVVITPEFAQVDIARISGKLNTKTSVTDTCRTKTSFDVKHTMRTSDKAATALDTPPEYGLLLKAAGFDETIDTTLGAETVIYTNSTDTLPHVSAVAFLDGQKFTFTDSLACGVTLDLKAGEVATITNNFAGYMDSATPTVEANPTVTLTDESALVVSCADIVTYDGTSLPLENVTIKMNEEMQDIYTVGGADGIKSNFVSDYALELTADFYVDSATFGREALNVESGDMKEIIVKIGLDSTSTEVNGKTVVLTASLAKTITYSDTVDKDLLKRSVTYRLMDNATPALSIKNGFYA